MSDDHATPPEPGASSQGVDKRAAKADLAAAKARAKAERPLWKKKRVILPAIVLLIVVAATAGGGDDDPTDTDTPVAGDSDTSTEEANGEEVADDDEAVEGEEEPETTGVGSPARDGSFEFTVDGLECGRTSVGSDFMEETPQGQFCLLDVRVENIGTSAQTLFSDNQYLLDDAGTQYSADSMATIVLDEGGDSFFSQINPGNAVDGVIVFDVPESADITRARLHDSVFSGGVEVPLG